MLLTEESIAENPLTGALERVFPSDFLGGGVGFEQVSPTVADLREWASDPAFVIELNGGNFPRQILDFGLRNVARLNVLNGLRLVDFARAQQGRMWAMANNIGLVTAEDLSVIQPAANAVIGSMINVLGTEPDMLAEEIARMVALSFYEILSSLPIPSAQWKLAMTVVGVGRMALNVFGQLKPGFVDHTKRRLPLRSLDDDGTLDAGRVDLMHARTANEKDWTFLFAPAYTGDWQVLEIGEAKWGQMGFGFVCGEGDEATVRGDGAFGFMPGTNRTLGVLQQIMGWKSLRDVTDDTNTATWRSVWCTAKSVPCGQTAEDFRGNVDCRQCIPADSIRGTSHGDWREDAGPRGWSTADNYVTNAGDFLTNSTQALGALWDSLSPTNPAACCVDSESLFRLWKDQFTSLFEGDAERLWKAHDGLGWRAICSMFFASMLISREDGLVGGLGTQLDWRQSWGECGSDGIWLETPPGVCPLFGKPGKTDAAAILGITATHFRIENSIWKVAIQPAVEHLARVQRRIYESTMVAYLWERQGSHWDAGTDKLRKTWSGKAYEAGLRAVLDTPRLRQQVHMGHVVDPKIRQLLIEAGAKPWQTGANLMPPSIPLGGGGGKPPRAPSRLAEVNPILAFDPSEPPLPGPPPDQGGFPGNPLGGEIGDDDRPDRSASSSSSAAAGPSGSGVGLALLAALPLGALGMAGLRALRGRRR